MNNRRWFEQTSSSKRGKLTSNRHSGQSLVEMALVMPILLLMLIGVFEVGWALRAYLVLSNVNREGTRFAARGRYLDFNQETPEAIGYPLVVSHTLDSLAGQLPVDLSPTSTNAGIIISHYVVDTGQPCTNMSTCTCPNNASDFDTVNAGNIDAYEQLRGPGPQWDNTDEWRYTSRPDLVSRIDEAALRRQLKDENNTFNCQLYKKDPSAPWSINSVIAVELFYNQPQLVGIFDTQSILGRAIIPNPVPLYTQTKMRITADARTGGRQTGTGCALYPFAMSYRTVAGRNPGDSLGDITNDNALPGNFMWLRWPPNPSAGDVGYLNQSLIDPGLAASDFEDAKEAGDNAINVSDWVWGNPGVSNANDVREAMDALIGQDIRVPVYDAAEGTGINGMYRVAGFVVIRITGYDLSGTDRITAQFIRWDNEACPGNGY